MYSQLECYRLNFYFVNRFSGDSGMRKLLLLFGVLITNAMFAGICIQQMENSDYEKVQTIFVEVGPENLDSSSEGLYAYCYGDWLEVISLSRTSCGYEVELRSEEFFENRGPSQDWICPHCKRVNSMFRRICKYCGKHPNSPK